MARRGRSPKVRNRNLDSHPSAGTSTHSELSGAAAWGRISARGLDIQVISIELMLVQVRWSLVAPLAALGGLRPVSVTPSRKYSP